MKLFSKSIKLFSFIIILVSLTNCGKKNTKSKAPENKALGTSPIGKLNEEDLKKPGASNDTKAGDTPVAPNSTHTNSSAELESISDDIWCLGDKGPREPLQTKGGIVDGVSLRKVKFLRVRSSGPNGSSIFSMT